MPFGKKKEAQQSQNDSTFSWVDLSKSGGPDENYFVSSRGLLKVCDFHPLKPVSTSAVLEGYPAEMPKTASTIYICSSALPQFVATMLPRIQHPFVLVSGNSTEDIPFDVFPTPNQFDRLEQEAQGDWEARLLREKQERQRAGVHCHDEHAYFRCLLEHDKLAHWFCQNWCGGPRKKVTAMPLGLDYHSLADGAKAGQWSSAEEQERDLIAIRESAKPFWERSEKCYGNFHTGSESNFVTFNDVDGQHRQIIAHLYDRRDALRLLDPAVMEYEKGRIPRVECWRRQSEFAFVASPHGVGLDCHRTWEALVLGCIPIVKSSKIDVLYKDLPVLIVDSWDQVTPDLLQKTVRDMQSETFHYEKLSMTYWSKLIKSHLEDTDF